MDFGELKDAQAANYTVGILQSVNFIRKEHLFKMYSTSVELINIKAEVESKKRIEKLQGTHFNFIS